jgi:D-sedoheptulose 7-phosphate isomerase
MESPNAIVGRCFDEHLELLALIREQHYLIEDIAASWCSAIKAGCKLMLCGNGGSAADSQHIAAELVGRFKKNRAALPAIALTTDTSALTAIGNDFGFEYVFSRQVQALGLPNDILVMFSTSGNSENLVQAAGAAASRGCQTLAILGGDGGRLSKVVHKSIIVPSRNTARVQEMHILIGHILCEIVENELNEAGSL